MRIGRRRTAGWVLLPLVGLLGVSVAPASAATVATVTFVATLDLGGPLDWPCVTTTKLCPVTLPGLVGTHTGPKGEPNLDVHPGGNRVAATLASAACVLAGAHPGEAPKSAVEAGTCSLGASGTTTGFCGLSKTMLMGSLVGPSGGVGSPQSMPFILELTDVGGVVLLSGLIAKSGNLGNLHGVGTMVAVPEPGVPPGNDCLAKTADRFTLTATMAVKVLD